MNRDFNKNSSNNHMKLFGIVNALKEKNLANVLAKVGKLEETLQEIEEKHALILKIEESGRRIDTFEPFISLSLHLKHAAKLYSQIINSISYEKLMKQNTNLHELEARYKLITEQAAKDLYRLVDIKKCR